MNTLLTGFGPFRDIVSNPTERLVRHFACRSMTGHRITSCILPVSYERVPAILIKAIELGDENGRPFELIWMLGVAAESESWRIERFGHNENGIHADADNYVPSSRIDSDGPNRLTTTVPVDAIVARLNAAGLPAEASSSAGGYLCNYALYTALRHNYRTGPAPGIGFLHIPADPESRSHPGEVKFSFEHHVQALTISLDVLASQLSDRVSAGPATLES